MDNKILRPPQQLTNLNDPSQLQELNNYLMDLWRLANNGITETLSFATAAGKVATIEFQNGSAVDRVVT